MSSAAEKLKALVARFDSESQNDAYEAEQTALAALPEIIAVVKAAERREDFAAPGVARLVADLDQALTVEFE